MTRRPAAPGTPARFATIDPEDGLRLVIASQGSASRWSSVASVSSGLEVSAVGVGCNQFGRRVDGAGVARIVHAAIDAGVSLFDTADIYAQGESERLVGRRPAGAA